MNKSFLVYFLLVFNILIVNAFVDIGVEQDNVDGIIIILPEDVSTSGGGGAGNFSSTSGPYLYDDGTTIYLNETKLNFTIDDLDDVGVGGGGNPFNQWLNTTNNVTFNNVTSTGWFHGLFDWIINTISLPYLSFNGSTLTFNETKLNETITSIGGNSSWNESYAGGLYAPNTTAGIQYLINSTNIYSTYNATYNSLASGNLSWNETYADDRYVNIDGDNMTGNLGLNTDVEIKDINSEANIKFDYGSINFYLG